VRSCSKSEDCLRLLLFSFLTSLSNQPINRRRLTNTRAWAPVWLEGAQTGREAHLSTLVKQCETSEVYFTIKVLVLDRNRPIIQSILLSGARDSFGNSQNHVYFEALHSHQNWPIPTRTPYRPGTLDALSRRLKARPRSPRGRILQPKG